MPIFDYLCVQCGKINEVLVSSSEDKPRCFHCGSDNLKKMLSAPSSLSGSPKTNLPGPGDTSCCGSTPSHAGCSGPGSCCGKFQA